MDCVDLFIALDKKIQFLQVKHIYESSPAIAERIPFSHGVYMPSIPALRKYKLLLHRFPHPKGNVKFFKLFCILAL